MIPESWATVLDVYNRVMLGYFAGLNLVYLLTGVVAFWALRRHNARVRSLGADELITAAGAPPITLIAPTFNEEPTCVEATRSLLALEYPAFEVLVVNDGSNDGTVARLIEAFELRPASRAPMATLPGKPVRGVYRSRIYPNLWLVDKVNGGKSDALNVGLNYCQAPFFCAIDADTLLDRDALTRIVRPFLENDDTEASGGVIRVVNDCEVRAGRVVRANLPRRQLPGFQVVEYLRAFLSGRIGWSAMHATLIISGAFGLFRRSTVVSAGGFDTATVGEDMELVIRLHRFCRARGRPYRIVFVPDPVAWTEVPETLAVLAKQRIRWQRGLYECLSRNLGMMFNPKYGPVGMLAFPFYFFFELVGPILELLGYVVFIVSLLYGLISPPFAIAFFLLAFVLGAMLSVAAVAQEELAFHRYRRFGDLFRLMFLALLENFGYRQLTSVWRAWGVVRAMLGHPAEWVRPERRGFDGPAAATGSGRERSG